ncbi:phosphodiester glycosidase family protein [Prosthecobacter sp. SYSU 5D2]|uniref:phosphodiester glycosidase family protein n=1 Tax=Prosthecobacter sp. SYSU 5D2 TaxID=3134134 RepID=UPI0031FEB49C
MRSFTSLLLWLTFSLAARLHATESMEHEGALYHLHRVAAADHAKLDLRWTDPQGKPLSDFGGLQKQLTSEGKTLLFATNAGIYERGPKPCGLTISAFKELVPLNLADGYGNFFLKPNGVFYLDAITGPGIVTSTEYPSLNLRPRIANQSGPILLRKGAIHPAFQINSPNKRQRSAVGIVTATKEIVFVMSDREDRVKGRVTFHQLSRFFLHLGCQNALYLDGDISQMITSPAPETQFAPNTFAAMFVVID